MKKKQDFLADFIFIIPISIFLNLFMASSGTRFFSRLFYNIFFFFALNFFVVVEHLSFKKIQKNLQKDLKKPPKKIYKEKKPQKNQ